MNAAKCTSVGRTCSTGQRCVCETRTIANEYICVAAGKVEELPLFVFSAFLFNLHVIKHCNFIRTHYIRSCLLNGQITLVYKEQLVAK